MAAPIVASFSVGETGGGSSIDPGAPTGLSVGDFVVLTFHADGNKTPTWPTGFTELYKELAPAGDATNAAAWKIWEAGDTTAIGYSDSGAHGYGASALRITGHHATTPIHVIGTGADGESTIPVCPSITTTVNDCLILRFYAADGSDGTDVPTEDAGFPASHTGLFNRNFSTFRPCAAGGAHIEQASAGATGTATWGALSGSQQWSAHTLAIAPSAGAGTVVGLATEIDTAFAVTATKRKAVGVAPEVDSALPVSSRRALEVGLAQETDSAFGVSGGLGSAAEDVWAEEDRVLCLIASPFDETIETTFGGPPVPHGMRAHGAERAGWTAAGAETQVYFSDVGYTSKPTDDPPNRHFEARLVSSFNYQVRLFQGDEPSGRSKPGLGDIRLGNGDGGLDGLLMLGWPGRTLRLYEGRKGAAFSEFALRAVMTTDGLNWTEGEVSIRLRDQQGLFNRNISADFYSGDGALGGDATVAGVARPQAYGELFNIEPILINAGLLVYQFHDRQAEAVVAVRDRGIALALDTTVGTNGDVADYDALAAATVAAGKYATCLALGLIRLGAAPGGRVTADVKGDAQGGYVDTAGTIVRRIVTTRMGSDSLSDPDDLDIGAFALLETDQPASIGIYLGTDRRLVDDILDQIMSSVGGFWDMTLRGKLRPAILKAPSGTAADTLTVADIADKPQLQRTGIRPSALRRVGYQRMWTVQSADELAAGVTAADRARYSREFRFALASDQGVATKVKLAREVETPGLFVDQADADTEAGRLQAFYGQDLSRYAVAVKRSEFLRQLNDIIDVEGLGRFGFAATQKFRLVGIQANAASGQVIWELLG